MIWTIGFWKKTKHLTEEFYIIFSFLYIYGKFTIIYKVVT